MWECWVSSFTSLNLQSRISPRIFRSLTQQSSLASLKIPKTTCHQSKTKRRHAWRVDAMWYYNAPKSFKICYRSMNMELTYLNLKHLSLRIRRSTITKLRISLVFRILKAYPKPHHSLPIAVSLNCLRFSWI